MLVLNFQENDLQVEGNEVMDTDDVKPSDNDLKMPDDDIKPSDDDAKPDNDIKPSDETLAISLSELIFVSNCLYSPEKSS